MVTRAIRVIKHRQGVWARADDKLKQLTWQHNRDGKRTKTLIVVLLHGYINGIAVLFYGVAKHFIDFI